MTGTAVVVRPVRFTDRIEDVAAFLELVGLARRVETVRGGWVELVGHAGMVALHDAGTSVYGHRSGQTTLAFEADDLDALVERLHAATFADATVIDEGYGRVLEVTDPLGDVVSVDEHSDDLYGYRVVDGGPPRADLRVVPVRFTDESETYAGFLRALGLTGTADPSYSVFEAAGGAHGAVGVHYVYTDTLPIAGGPGPGVHLTFTTTEDLDELAARLGAAGFTSTRTDEDFGSFLDITDPDGQSVQVHAR